MTHTLKQPGPTSRRSSSASSRHGRAATSPSWPPGSCSSPSSSATRADLHAGWRVLDVATGSGNAAIAAARLGCAAVGVDYVPALLERGRSRAAAEGLTSSCSRATPRRCRSRTPRSTP